MRRFLAYGADLTEGDAVTLDPEESAHLTRVLRLSVGARVILFNGRGDVVEAEVVAVSSAQTRCRVIGPVAQNDWDASAGPFSTLIFGLSKKSAAEWSVQKAVELGVGLLWPVECRRSVVRAEGGPARQQRWERIIRDAAKQSGRATLPELRSPTELATALLAAPAEARKFVCWEAGRNAPPLSQALRGDDPGAAPEEAEIWIVIGPEGGLTDDEIISADEAGFQVVSLGGAILRAETAVTAALTLIAASFGRM